MLSRPIIAIEYEIDPTPEYEAYDFLKNEYENALQIKENYDFNIAPWNYGELLKYIEILKTLINVMKYYMNYKSKEDKDE